MSRTGRARQRGTRSTPTRPVRVLTDPLAGRRMLARLRAHRQAWDTRLDQVEDRRLFTPDRTVRRLTGVPRYRLTTTPPVARRPGVYVFGERMAFMNPLQMVICVRRRIRRQVLFAKRRTGRGARSKRHYNSYSEVVC